jgi:serine/threonine protein phosphatase PrpC
MLRTYETPHQPRACLYWLRPITLNGRQGVADGENDLAVTITAAAHTDIGCVRKSNQDTFGTDPGMRLYVVCDGMGGAAGGEIASRLAVDAFLESFRASSLSPEPALHQAAMVANAAVLARAEAEPALRGMGSTLIAAHVEADRLHLVNIGDSRAYLIRAGECAQLTVDHSYLEEQVSLGLMTREMANASPLQSVITRAVGIHEGFEPDLTNIGIEDGDFVLLTSDGLTRHIGNATIADIVAAQGSVDQHELDARCVRLIECAKQRGGSDNITCILLQFVVS